MTKESLAVGGCNEAGCMAGGHGGHQWSRQQCWFSTLSKASTAAASGKEKPDHESRADGPRSRLLWPHEQPQL